MKLAMMLSCSLLAGAVLADAAPERAPPLPIEYFTRHDDFGTLKISPDGEFVAMTMGKFGREVLAFIDLSGRKAITGIRAPERFEIHDFYWVSPTRVIHMIAERQPGMVRPTRTGEIFAVDRDGKNGRMLYGYRAAEDTRDTRIKKRRDSYATPELISTLKDDEKNILIAEYPWELRGNYWAFNPDAKPRITLLNVYDGLLRKLDTAPLRGATVLVRSRGSSAIRFGTQRRHATCRELETRT